jgi:hypothetical protein
VVDRRIRIGYIRVRGIDDRRFIMDEGGLIVMIGYESIGRMVESIRG